MTQPDLTPISLFGSLPIARYRITVRLATPLPGHMGSAWRGLIGWELKRLICPFVEKRVCKPCIIRNHCPYFRLFEDQSPMSGIQEMPRGYIFTPTDSKRSCTHHLNITLIGDCISSFPAIAQAVDSGKTVGLGPGRIPYRIAEMDRLLPDGATMPLSFEFCDGVGMSAAFPLSDWLAPAPVITGNTDVSLVTPVRLKKQGKNMGQMEWSHYFATLVRRLESLNCLFADGEPIGKAGYQDLMARFSAIKPVRQDLSWIDYSRYSNRQNKKVPMGGLAGTATFSRSDMWLVPWLQAAQLIHVGKGASMGLGQIFVHPDEHGDEMDVVGA